MDNPAPPTAAPLAPDPRPALDPRPQVWPAFVGFAAALMIAQVVGGGLLAVLFIASRPLEPALLTDPTRLAREIMDFVAAPGTVLAASATSATVLLATAFVGARLSKVPAAVRLRLGPSRLGWGRTAAAAAGAVALSFSFGALVSLTGLDGIGILHVFDKVFRSATPAVLALAILFIGVSAPIGEELFFRGFMQTRLAAAWSRWAAIGVTAAAFGVLHMDPIQSVFALCAGLYLGWLTEIAGSIRPAIAAHAVNNIISVAGAAAGSSEPSRTADLLALAGGLLVLGAVLFFVRRGQDRAPSPDGAREGTSDIERPQAAEQRGQ